MRKVLWTLTIFALLAMSAAAALLVTTVMKKSVYVDGTLYPADAQVLDFRGKNLSAADYKTFSEALPNCYIAWDIPFQDGRLDCETQMIAVTDLTQTDVDKLADFPKLKVLDGRGCKEYALMQSAQEKYPNIKVLYQVEVDGQILDQDTESVEVPNLDAQQVEELAHLPKLNFLDACGVADMDFLRSVQKAHPEWKMIYNYRLDNKRLDGHSTEVTVEILNAEETRDVLSALGLVKVLRLEDPRMTLEEIQALQAEYPDIEIHWTWKIGRQLFMEDSTEVELRGMTLSGVAEAKEIAAKFPNLQRLALIDCGLDNDTLAAYRDEVREQYKVVWKVYLGDKSTAMSDTTYFSPTQQNDRYFLDGAAKNLKYLEDCEAVDMGEQQNLTDCTWVASMPKLKYLILQHTKVTNISALAGCKELAFLELDLYNQQIESLAPLKECTKLTDLNLGCSLADAKPLTEMTWLKNLWWTACAADARPGLEAALKETTIKYPAATTESEGWQETEGYANMKAALHLN